VRLGGSDVGVNEGSGVKVTEGVDVNTSTGSDVPVGGREGELTGGVMTLHASRGKIVSSKMRVRLAVCMGMVYKNCFFSIPS
jgi:hypothetical protein